MKEMVQAGNFYHSLQKEEQEELTGALAESLFFQAEALQKEVIRLLADVDQQLSCNVAEKVTETALQEGLTQVL